MNKAASLNSFVFVLFMLIAASPSFSAVFAKDTKSHRFQNASLMIDRGAHPALQEPTLVANNYYRRQHKYEVDYRNPVKYNRGVAKHPSYGNPMGPSIIMPASGRYLKRPAGINPKASSYYNQGLVKYNQGRINDSITWMKKAVGVDPRVPNAQYNIGVLLFNQGKFSEAKGWFQRVLRFNPGDTNASHWLSKCSQANGLSPRAPESPVGNLPQVNPDYNRRLQVSSNKYQNSQNSYDQRRQMAPRNFGKEGNPIASSRTYPAQHQSSIAIAPPASSNRQPVPSVSRNTTPIPVRNTSSSPPTRVFGNSNLSRPTPPTPPVKPSVNQKATPVISAVTSKPTDAPIKDKWALIIGISKFQRSEYNLAYSAKDARDFYNFLVTEANFKKDHVKLLIDEQATRANIMGAFGSSWLPRVTEPGDLVVVYVSTHGTPADVDNGGRNYIVAYDTDANDLYPTGVDMDEIYRRIKEGVKTDRALIVLDTCYSGSAVPGARALVRSTNFDLSKIQLGSGHLVISSSSPGEKSWESKRYRNGIFTHRLIEALRQKNKLIDVKAAFKDLKSKVSWEVKCDRKKSQTPQLGGDWKGAGLVIAAPATSPRSLSN